VQRFRALADLSLGRLREHIRMCLIGADSVLLSDILQRFPPREGVLEVIGYLVVAMQDAKHYVAGDQFASVQLDSSDGRSELWRIPEVLFARS
jgi:hypothetical protein